MFRELFSENSSISSMRVMSMISLLIGGGIAVYGVYMAKDLSGLAALVGIFVGSAFGGKLIQKNFETKTISDVKAAVESMKDAK